MFAQNWSEEEECRAGSIAMTDFALTIPQRQGRRLERAVAGCQRL